MRTRSLSTTVLLTACAMLTPALSVAAQQEEFVVVKAGTVITVSGEEIPRGEIVIVDGKIRLVGRQLEYPAGATIIEARGETVMPGWINPCSRHGLSSYSRNGVHGDYTVDDEVYLDEIDFEPMLENGFTAVGLFPDGQGIPGVASVYRTAVPDDLDEYGDDSQLLLQTSYLRVLMTNASSDKRQIRGALAKAKSELDKIKKAREEWDKKQKEAEAKKAEEDKKKPEAEKNGEGQPKAPGNGEPPKEEKKEEKPEFKPPATDAGHQPLMDWIEGKLAVRPLIELRDASSFVHLQDVLDKYEDPALQPNLLLTPRGFNADLNYIVEELAANDAILLTTIGMYRLPQTSTVYNLVGALDQAGADLALMPENASGGGGGGFRGRRGGGGPPPPTDATGLLRSARVRIADLVRAGLSRESALKAVTINPAKVLGVDSRVGTIEPDKDADLIFMDGDALDPHTRVTRVMILGEVVWEKDK